MSETKQWQLPVLVVGAAYVVDGVVTGALAGSAATHQMVVFWRLVAWASCAALGAGHVWYEVFRLRGSALSAATHAALAVAIGGFGLAAAANIHSLTVPSDHRALIHLSLVIWPILLGAPAFLLALAAAAVLARFRRS